MPPRQISTTGHRTSNSRRKDCSIQDLQCVPLSEASNIAWKLSNKNCKRLAPCNETAPSWIGTIRTRPCNKSRLRALSSSKSELSWVCKEQRWGTRIIEKVTSTNSSHATVISYRQTPDSKTFFHIQRNRAAWWSLHSRDTCPTRVAQVSPQVEQETRPMVQKVASRSNKTHREKASRTRSCHPSRTTTLSKQVRLSSSTRLKQPSDNWKRILKTSRQTFCSEKKTWKIPLWETLCACRRRVKVWKKYYLSSK